VNAENSGFAGAALTALGILLAIAGLASLGSALTPFPRPLAKARLRRSGVYAWVRHPVYARRVRKLLPWIY
jgi:protein-S-isoprenylcysteine O-methyltransferase Ste14